MVGGVVRRAQSMASADGPGEEAVLGYKHLGGLYFYIMGTIYRLYDCAGIHRRETARTEEGDGLGNKNFSTLCRLW